MTLNTLSPASGAARHGGETSDAECADADIVYESSKELSAWRRAVVGASSMSQLACCLLRLHHSIAWEKSIMKVVSPPRSALPHAPPHARPSAGVRPPLCASARPSARLDRPLHKPELTRWPLVPTLLSALPMFSFDYKL